jgi:hypothetical protein
MTGPGENETRDDAMPEPDRSQDTIDFFGASASPTLPVPSTPEPAPEPAAPAVPAPALPVPADQRVQRGIRVRTLVFGLVALAISIVSGIGLLTDVRLEGGVVGLGLMIGAGAGLLIGGLSAAVRDVRRGGSRFT